jgi:ribosomal protein S12 methylthiotransferase accessory factor
LTESLQGRQLGNLDGFQTPVFDEDAVAEDENIENHFIDSSGLIHARFISDSADYEFHDWDFSGTTQQQWQSLVDLVQRQGTDVYVAQYEHYDFPSCRIIVPGMSEIYPCDELVQSNQNVGRNLRDLLLSLDATTDFDEHLDELDALGLSEHQGIASLIGLMPDPGSFWSQLKVTDLRFWLALAAGNHDAALESVQESLYFVDPVSHWGVRYKAFEFALEMHASDSINQSTMTSLFGSDLTDKVIKNITGDEIFFGEPIGLDIFLQSERHQSMLKIYDRIRQVKQERFV